MTYLARLHEAHQIEVSGEAFYAAAARLARAQDRRAQWQTLAKLETQTKERVAAAIANLGDSAKERKRDAWLGYVVGGLLACLPWGVTLRLMRPILTHATSFWQRLAREHLEGDARLHEYLIAHEQAQTDFVRDELAGIGKGSLHHVLNLLDA